jgi:hypothetical protein
MEGSQFEKPYMYMIPRLKLITTICFIKENSTSSWVLKATFHFCLLFLEKIKIDRTFSVISKMV